MQPENDPPGGWNLPGGQDTPDASILLAALEQADEAFIITDTGGRIRYVNGAFERMTGYSRAEALGNTPSMLKSGRQDESFYRELWRTIAEGRPWRGRFINRRKDGTLYEQWATIAPLREHGGALGGFVAVQLDMTHQLDLERRLARAECLAAMGQAIAGAAHSIKNILNTMKGSAYVVSQALKTGDLEKLRQIWEVYARSTARLEELARQMLDYVRPGAPATEPVDLNRLAGTVAADCRPRAVTLGAVLEFEPAEALPQVPCDRAAIQDAVLNLVVNAVEACADHGNGRVRLATRQRPEAGTVELIVEDNGPGIAPENLALLFQPFFSTKGNMGNGLGLAMVRKTVQAHGGNIEVESAPGRTCFVMRLPL